MGEILAAGDPERLKRHQSHITETMRQIGLNIIGVGSVGSMAAFILLKMGFYNTRVFDADKVEEHNLGNQIYPDELVGTNKALALAKEMTRHGIKRLDAVPENFGVQNLIPGVVVSAVDSKEARREIWRSVKTDPGVELYIDSRMGLEQAKVYAINPQKRQMVEWYERSLEGKGLEEECTAKTTYYTVSLTAWFIGSHLARFVRKDAEIPPLVVGDSVNLYVTHGKVS
jgi:hypothetical protein